MPSNQYFCYSQVTFNIHLSALSIVQAYININTDGMQRCKLVIVPMHCSRAAQEFLVEVSLQGSVSQCFKGLCSIKSIHVLSQ